MGYQHCSDVNIDYLYGNILGEMLLKHADTQQKRMCKIMQDCAQSCIQDLLGTCTRCPFSCMILAQSCTYLARNGARFCKRCCKNNYLQVCTFFARSCKNWRKIVQESCKKRDISRARAKQVLHACNLA